MDKPKFEQAYPSVSFCPNCGSKLLKMHPKYPETHYCTECDIIFDVNMYRPENYGI